MPPNARILIVDDHEGSLYAPGSALAPLGHLLGRATSGDEAPERLLRGNVGLLLLDVQPSDAGRLDVVRSMRRLERTGTSPSSCSPDTSATRRSAPPRTPSA